uniref:Uncharacterized protein n=1 Tax=Lygus hesperus TaxID=30085 RepID=A0A146LJA4_LYGHE
MYGARHLNSVSDPGSFRETDPLTSLLYESCCGSITIAAPIAAVSAMVFSKSTAAIVAKRSAGQHNTVHNPTTEFTGWPDSAVVHKSICAGCTEWLLRRLRHPACP